MPARSLHSPTKPQDEKLTINVGFVDLGQIDLLVQEGFYANRSDLIRTAIRSQLASHADVLKQAVSRKLLVLGIHRLGADELRAMEQRGETVDLRVLGLASIADDVSPELARATIASLSVLGAFHASAAVKAALADRMRA
jgi:Arc/MetJ-type ribon-helix-helix transcriptional regulator